MPHCIVLNVKAPDLKGGKLQEIITGHNRQAVENAATQLQRSYERMGATVTRGI